MLIKTGGALAPLTSQESDLITYLKHPVHGTKVATLEAEVEADKEKGWVEFDPANRDKEEEAPNNELRRRRRQDAA